MHNKQCHRLLFWHIFLTIARVTFRLYLTSKSDLIVNFLTRLQVDSRMSLLYREVLVSNDGEESQRGRPFHSRYRARRSWLILSYPRDNSVDALRRHLSVRNAICARRGSSRIEINIVV